MKQSLLTEYNRLKSTYGSLMATVVFQQERKRYCRIARILFFRYKISIS